jgi:ribosomal protein S18 acetylase RimI-like enzyme
MPHDNSLRIGPVLPAGQDEALRLLLTRVAPAERPQQMAALAAAAAASEGGVNGLLGAYRGERLVGAVFFQVQPGKTATVWPPQVAAGEEAAITGRLLDTACNALAQLGTRTAQALTETDAQPEAEVLSRAGFAHVADLLYLVSPDSEFPTHPPSSPLHFEPYSPANHRRLVAVVDQTYEHSLDCPQLDGVRDTEDVLAGYRATGAFDPRRWLIVRHDGHDIGCLLVSDHPEHNTCELVYMGVVPAARGHAWGMDIARHAQWLAREAGRPRLALAVDAANEPAIRMYAAVGFQTWDRRAVWLKVFS